MNGMKKNDYLVILFLFTITLIYYLPVLTSQTHQDNINVLNGCCWINRTLYSIILMIGGLNTFKLFFLLMVSLIPVYIYLFSHDKLYGFLYGLFVVLIYDKFIFYAYSHDSMCMVLTLSFMSLYYQNIKSILLLSFHRIENLILITYKKPIYIILPLIIYLYSKNRIVETHFRIHLFFFPYQINDFGSLAYLIILSGLIGSLILFNTDKRYKYLLYMALLSHLWVYAYGDYNPRYYLQFIVLWYYIAFYPIYLIVKFMIKRLKLYTENIRNKEKIINKKNINPLKTRFIFRLCHKQYPLK